MSVAALLHDTLYKLTGDQIAEVDAIQLMIARLVAFFSLVCPQVLAAQPSMMLLHAYTPMAKQHIAK
jgi:hypothetical protein